MTAIEKLHGALTTLGLKAVEAKLENILEQASKSEPSYADFLDQLLGCEVDARRTRYLRARLQLAHFPFVKTFEQFDFAFQPSIDERQIRELRTLRFVHEASNVILLGPPGVGKTHLSVSLAEAAIQSGFGAYFITAHDLVSDLGRAYREGRLDRRLRIYLAPKVLVIDEMGYLPLDDLGATIFFQLVSARYERGSIILTSNKSYGDWGSIFGDPIIATAILDRLLHHSTTINIRGESYRVKERRRAGLLPSPRRSAARIGASSGCRPEQSWQARPLSFEGMTDLSHPMDALPRAGRSASGFAPGAPRLDESEPTIPWRVGLHRSPPPLHRPVSILGRPAKPSTTTSHWVGNFQPAKQGIFNRP